MPTDLRFEPSVTGQRTSCVQGCEINGDSNTFPAGGLAVVIGASGGIGRALLGCLSKHPRFGTVMGFGRGSSPPLDLTDEESIAQAVRHVQGLGRDVRLVINAVGILHEDGLAPEKSWGDLDGAHMARSFAVNAIGPALLMKHFLPLLPRHGRAVFATLSARVGSIGDNRLGGWFSYRSSKAALNQIVRTAAIELARRRPDALCVALHPGTVDTRLSAPFAKRGVDIQTAETAANRLVAVIERLSRSSTGGFFDYRGEPVPW